MRLISVAVCFFMAGLFFINIFMDFVYVGKNCDIIIILMLIWDFSKANKLQDNKL